MNRSRSLLNFAIATIILLTLVLACSSKTKTEEFKSGRVKYVETLKFGPAGTHGMEGWYVTDRNFYVNDRRWSPDNIKVKDIGSCDPSPNSSVEALKCTSYADMKESVFILRMKDNQPEWVTASDSPYGSGENRGQWVGDGHWLLFREYYFNVSTSEQKPIKGLPDDPGNYVRAVSPDLKTIIYEEYCFTTRFDLPRDKSRDADIEKQCHLSNEHVANGIVAFWLIDTDTGAVKILELKKENYPTLDRSKISENDFNRNFQKILVWKKDENGKDQLVSPNKS
jgi:hypothetical protein